MKITVSQLRKIIREEVEKTLSQHKKDGWPDCNKRGCTGKMKPNPQSGNKTSLYCSKCGAEKKKAIKLESKDFSDYIREEVQKNLGEGYATLGLAQKIAGEYPEEEIREFLASPEPEGFGFMPDEIGDDLEGFLAGLSMKDLNTLEAHFGNEYGMWQSSTRKFRAAPLKDGGVVNRDSGEILDMDAVPPQYLDYVEIDAEGYTTLPNKQFEQLRGELSGTKPKKQWKAPFQLNREKM